MGVGVVTSDGGTLGLVYAGVLAPRRRDAISQRLGYLLEELSRVIEEWRPSEVAIEEPFVARNVRTALAIGHAQAVAMVAAAQHGLSVAGYPPRRVKQSITDHGGSSKEQVRDMVGLLLGVDVGSTSLDATDALAVAICHINAGDLSRLAAGQ
jgi:crossover junction endodeoxyribonuclease RuvC